MNSINQKGYLWKCYGFTMTHMWGLHAMSAILTVVGVGMLTFAILEFNRLEDATF